MEDLITTKLNMSIKEFEKIELKNVNINLEKLNLFIVIKNMYNTKEYLYFYFACIFIAEYLNKNLNLKIYIKSIYPEFIRNIKTGDNLKTYQASGFNKFITCKLINCSPNILKTIPKKLFNIPIIIVPLYDKKIKMPFQLGKIKLDNNELNIIEENNNNILSWLYKLFFTYEKNYIVTYCGNIEDTHTITYDNKKLTYTVTETSNNMLKSHTNIKKEIKIKKTTFDYIIYKKIYE